MVNKKKKWSLAITSFILFGLLLIIGTHLSPMASAAEESDTYETYTDRTGLGLYGDIRDFFYKDRTYDKAAGNSEKDEAIGNSRILNSTSLITY